MSKHTDFILSPISNILNGVVSANSGIGNGIETYPLSEYILQAVFLKMTGFQEQKMKCICWELATEDYEYRYKRYTLTPLGECSSYKEKNTIYNDLIDLIKKYKSDFDPKTVLNKAALRLDTRSEIKEIFSTSNLSSWEQSAFSDFVNDGDIIPTSQFVGGNEKQNSLFESKLIERYELLVKHRNRCAHNTLSYQENLPTLKTISHPNYKYDTYFVR
ncbi:MAG: hypothetical protein L0G39_10070, partial [Chryseobacterium sp.]|nr:hypothetical protein [Chryseobacterium sp.]